MGPAMTRLLEQWEPLNLFFTEERQKKKDKGQKVVGDILSRLYDFFRRRTPRLYVAFYAGMLRLFEVSNAYLQSDSARLHTIKRELWKLHRTLASSILKPAALNQGHPWDANLQNVNIKAPKQRFIGQDAQERLDAGVEPFEKTEFFENVTLFYKTSLKYIRDNLDPRKQELWMHGEVADIHLTKEKPFSSLTHFTNRFPCLLPEGVTMDQLQLEFQDFNCDGELPPANWDQLEPEECWKRLATLKDHKGCLRFKHLASVMLGILLIPVANAGCERVFSLVRKTRTDFRANMSASTLEALLIIKCHMSGTDCHSVPLSVELLRKCKRSTSSSD